MSGNVIPEPKLLKVISEKNKEAYKRELLDGPFLQRIIKNIEDAALNGYSGCTQTLCKGDNLKDYQIVQTALKESGYKCEIDTRTKQSPLFPSITYEEKTFVVRW